MSPSAPNSPAWLDAGDDIYVDLGSRVSQLHYGLQPLLQVGRGLDVHRRLEGQIADQAAAAGPEGHALGDLDKVAAAAGEHSLSRLAGPHLRPTSLTTER